MGDHEGWALPNGLLPNGLLPNEASSMTRALDSERWSKVEQKTAELIACIQPNQPSEEHRNAVANYVQRLITDCFSCQVFTFGSVPLKTYLPDGDIDLTAMSENETLKDTWAIKVSDMLKNEEKNEKAEFRVKEVQYIQAEVKIVKCLVENIVVDISFNQVGGLCTLCFLEEIDHLINQNHLFKRSIILIKAWCYYESRILGAHHGLISTYALETLVLYIFHVYNNTFAGPLEVLYRFLEFFSNFDWANFCVSLWGPVPKGLLPDMTAEPPRKDSGELLLSRLFLQACSTVYAVFPVGQETLGQSFVSKHFNVIDPLRTNNNLGRSVSKGNFFRIRSAFSFGAKRLARLLECPKENLIAEVNQFFTNTWERHGTGHRPDAPNPKLWQAQSIKTSPPDESNNSRRPANIKKNIENGVLRTGHQHHAEGHFTSQGSSSQVHGSISQYSQNAYGTSNSRSQSQKSTGVRVNSGDSGRFQFARTQSSPELTETSAEVLSRVAIKTAVETGKKQIANAGTDYGSRRNNLGSDVSGGQSAKSSIEDPSSLRHSSSHHSFEASADSNSVSNSYHDDTGFATTGEEFASVSEAFEMQQEEQDLVNLMASSRVHNYNGPVQFPMHLASPHLSLASVGYSQRNFAATVPNNILQFTQGFVSNPLSHYFPIAGLNTYRDDKAESVNGSSEVAEVSPEGSDVGVWHEYDAGSTRGFDPDSEGFQPLHSDDKQQSSLGVFNLVPSSRGSNSSNSSIRSQQEFSRGSARDDYNDAARYQTRRGSDIADLRYLPVSQASSSRSTYGSSRDGSFTKVSKSARDKWGGRQSSSSSAPISRKSKGGWQSDNVSSHEEDDNSDWVTLSTDRAEGVTGSDSILPIAPLLGGSSRPRTANGSGAFPFAFYPTGPPVPFLTMVPVYNFQSDGSKSQIGTLSDQNSDSIESVDQSEAPTTSVAVINSNPEHKADILNSDFASHWQNLQYGRFCQNTRNHGPLVYPSPAMAPPVYLQSHSNSRPIPSNLVMGYGPRLVPVMPMQAGPNRPSSGLLQHYGDESPRFRGGTGTYLPSHKASFRDRGFSNTRNHRGSYSYDRNEHSDREGSWISSKAKAAARNNGRDKRLDRSENRSWTSHKREPVASHDGSSSQSITYSVYPIPAVSSNGGSQTMPSVVMLYPYDQGVGYGPPSEALEFGSLGPVRLSGANEAPALSDVTSPDQPSSPRVQRSTARRNYQLKDEDFPPLPFQDNEEGDGGGGSNRPTHHRPSFFNSRHS